MGVGVEYSILGPFEVRPAGGSRVALGGTRQRALLAILALHANEVVSTDRLVDLLWGESPPTTALHTVRVFVSRLRSALGPAGDRLVTRPPGYALQIGTDELDADRCEHLCARGREALGGGEPARAGALLREAESLWRGAPLADFTYEPFAQATIARLEELRLACREDLIEADLALGRHAEAVSNLEALVREHPLRERPRAQLMLALYRCGRQADALDAFQQARRMLVGDLGVEPGAALRELEQAILRQDALLAPPAPEPERSPLPSPAETAAAGEPSAAVPRVPPVVPDTPPPAPPSGVARVRKTVTVLVGRLATRGPGSSTEPETAQRLLEAALGEAERIVARHGGTFVSGLGGEIVGVFGLPVTSEDDAVRALRAAHELRAGAMTLGAGESGDFVAALGLDTGEVIAKAPGDFFGEPLTRAAALARGAQEAEVLISDVTREMAGPNVEVDPVPDRSAWRLLELVADVAVLHPRQGIPLVGRDWELGTARATFERAAVDGVAHLLTVLGEAGIGKSRLAQELVDQLGPQATALTGRCLSYGDGVAFWPLREAVVSAGGGESRQALRRLLPEGEDADLVADVVAATVGLAPAEAVGEQGPWAFRKLLEMLARERPVLLVIEDAHWAERALLELIDYLVDWVTAPVVVLCLARPELLEKRPAWGGGHPRMSSLVLGRLSDADALRLADHHLGEHSLSEEQRAHVLETAEGNPLFVEQLLAMSSEDPGWGRERQIPATIENLLAARLDRLPPGERAVIERSALMGREFWPSAVAELLPPEVNPSASEHIRALVRRGMIRVGHPAPDGEEQLSFHHILIRDVAYRNTPKALRSELHERLATWLAGRREVLEEFVGYHLDQAFRYESELGAPPGRLADLALRAAGRLAAAGRQSLERGNPLAAIDPLRRAAELCEAGGDPRPAVLLDLGGAFCESGDFVAAERAFERALEGARAGGMEAVSARALIELSYVRALVDPTAGVGEMTAVADQAIAAFTRLDDDGGLSRAWLHMAEVHWTRSRCAEMETVLERALKHAERAGEPRARSRILGDLARATVIGPRPLPDGMARCASILERAGDDIVVVAVTETMLSVLEAMDGRFEDARERFRRTQLRLADMGLQVTLAVLQMYRAFIELMAGSPENAEPDVTEALATLERLGERRRLATTAALMARLLYAQGRYDDAERYCLLTEEAASADDVVSHVLWRGTRAKLLAQGGGAPRAEELADGGVALAHETDFLMLHADALRDRAEVLLVLGRPQAAQRDLEEAISLYERKGSRLSSLQAQRAYDALASGTAA